MNHEEDFSDNPWDDAVRYGLINAYRARHPKIPQLWDKLSKFRGINNGPGFWTTKDGVIMKIKDMETTHLINTVALIWRVTAKSRRALKEDRSQAPHVKHWDPIALQVDDPEAKIDELLEELERRDINPTFVRLR